MRRMSTDDPYRAPASPIEAGAGADRLPLEAASRWRRLCNLLVDYVAMASLSFVVVMAYSIAYFARHPMAQATPIESWGVVAEYAFGILVMLLYYTPLEALFGCTLGKLVTGTRVVNERGGKPSWGQALGRSFARLIPFEALSVLVASEGQVRGWHDALPRTWVVRKR